MIIKSAELTATVVNKKQYPADNLPEIAFAGRSNAGKSSLLNLLINRKSLARVSGKPGKTRTINFYEINGEFRIVDLPGYGYTQASKSETESWGDMIEAYLNGRNGLVKVVQLVDIRHDPSELDLQMYEYLRHYKLDGLVAATKADKIKRSETPRRLSSIRRALDLAESDRIIPVSALKRTGREELLAEIDRCISFYFLQSSERE